MSTDPQPTADESLDVGDTLDALGELLPRLGAVLGQPRTREVR